MRKKGPGTIWRKLSSGQEQWYRTLGLIVGRRNGKFLVITVPKPRPLPKLVRIKPMAYSKKK